MTPDEMIAIIRAGDSGQILQTKVRVDAWCKNLGVRFDGSTCDWTDMLTIQKAAFNFPCYDYRVKPEPPKPRVPRRRLHSRP